MQRGYIPSFRRSRSSPKLRWAESGPTEHPERVEVRYFNDLEPPISVSESVSEPVSESIFESVSDSTVSMPSRTPARRILKPARTDPFEWPMRSRARASSFTDEPMDWELATMDYEPKVLIGREDSKQASRVKKIKLIKEKSKTPMDLLRMHISPDKKKPYIRDWCRTEGRDSIMNLKNEGFFLFHPSFVHHNTVDLTKRMQSRLAEEMKQGYTSTPRKRPLKDIPPLPGLFKLIPSPR